MAAKDETEIRAQLTSLIFLAKRYQFLTKSRMTDFFVKDNFSKLPQSWRLLLSEVSVEDFGRFIDLNKSVPTSRLWPLSLLTLRQMIQTHCLPRIQHSIPCKTSEYSVRNETAGRNDCLTDKRLKYAFSKHVKPKKKYEIDKIAMETAKLAAETGAKFVIDTGSGLGHLCRVLGYGYGLNVIGIETQNDLIERARNWDKELEKTVAKVLTETDVNKIKTSRPEHVLKTISLKTTHADFQQMIRQSSNAGESDFGIVGLHPCGNLAPVLLRNFAKCENARFLILASCCYHKMYLNAEEPGFPLSRFLQSGKHILFDYESASWACHSIEINSKRLTTGDYEFLKIHCFRATLEEIINEEWPQHVRKSLNNVPHYPELTFKEYCRKALIKLGITVPESRFESNPVRRNLSRWKDVVLYHGLCLLLAPVSETIFQLDRLLYLAEQRIPCQLQATFDPEVSPRNYILTAIKSKN